ncbi:hypothetical protein [uncultured Winogradskyella sp.]|uniref:hypothetical protein n=1 Tax=uncultured Winogradskyella sp. TaxID=395353 RepID=UPI0030D9C300|tara:strand:- start:526 stop:693 length:168 start_codon:yes stop_codon:yes gene_type:complete
MKGELGIKYVELDKTSKSDSNISVFNIKGNDAFMAHGILTVKNLQLVYLILPKAE